MGFLFPQKNSIKSIYTSHPGEGNGTPLKYSNLENPMDRGAWWAAVHEVREELDTTERLHFDFSLSCVGEGNGNPLQCSCLENPRDRGAWWASIYGVTQNQTWLKWLSSSSSSSSRQLYRSFILNFLMPVGFTSLDSCTWNLISGLSEYCINSLWFV